MDAITSGWTLDVTCKVTNVHKMYIMDHLCKEVSGRLPLLSMPDYIPAHASMVRFPKVAYFRELNLRLARSLPSNGAASIQTLVTNLTCTGSNHMVNI